jgi:predicted dienelactone hydrolase
MALSYAFVVLFVAVAVLRALRKPSEKPASVWRKISRGVTVGLAVVSLALSAFLAAAMPVPVLPAPTGDYTVGVQYFDLVDNSRDNSLFTGSTDPREITVQIFYPAEDDTAVPDRHYARGSKDLVRKSTGFGVFADQLTMATTHAKENLPLAEDQARYPVVLFSHGYGHPFITTPPSARTWPATGTSSSRSTTPISPKRRCYQRGS